MTGMSGLDISGRRLTMKIFNYFISLFCLVLMMNTTAMAETKAYIYAFDSDYPPYAFMEKGKPTGFDIDVMKAIFKDKDVSIEYKPMQWGDVQEALRQGRVHATSGMAKKEERKKIYDFSQSPLCDLKISIFTTPRSHIRNLQDLKDKKVATQRGSLYQKLLEQRGFKPDLYETESEALVALFREKADAFVGTEKTALYNIRKYNLKGVFPISTPLEVSSTYFVVKKGDNDLLARIDEGMQRIKRDGTFDRIYRQWFVEELSAEEVRNMLSRAREAAFYAYAPYTNSIVGAAVLTSSGKIYTGCNIENAIVGYTATATKVAVFKAISEGESHFKAVVSIYPGDRIGAPAPDERQIIAEFDRGTLVVIDDGRGNYRHVMISELLPFFFQWDQ
jgi:glutamine transport system substrate-binding protein